MRKIFFVDRNDKEDFPEPMEDWEKTESEDHTGEQLVMREVGPFNGSK